MSKQIDNYLIIDLSLLLSFIWDYDYICKKKCWFSSHVEILIDKREKERDKQYDCFSCFLKLY